MCGICGYIKFNQQITAEDRHIVEAMNRKLVHRGPDAQDITLFDNVALGFCRLSIIGLDNGMQPVFNEDNSVVLVCNGEIFNYIELKKTLQDKGHVFKTMSDVEVIVHLYEEYGQGFLNKLNGQFSFALYDKKRQLMFCARDQLGILPFFYTIVHNTFIFASEIKAILAHPLVPAEVDVVGLDQVLTFAGLISPRTLFRNICSLENGHSLTVDTYGNVKKQEYWDLIFPEGEVLMNGKPEQYYIDRLEELFDTSVRLRLRADVPLGLYLSGGLDSSIIAMKLNQLKPSVNKSAFSIDFIESQYSEAAWQKQVARASNCELSQKMFFFDDISNRLEDVIYHCECPIKETYNAASLSLSQSVRESQIKVILSGEGADEFFAGYVGYRFDKMRALNLMQHAVSPMEAHLREALWGDADFFYERDFHELNQVKKQLYSADIRDAFEEVNCLNHPIINSSRIRNRDLLNKRAYIDYKIRLVDHLVADHGDRMAMANSVEVRYPFLDKELVEFSAQLPSSLKLNGFTEKYILRKMADRFVPPQITSREKFHFIAPGSPYLLKKNIEFINDTLSSNLLKKQGFFNPEQIEHLRKTYMTEGFAVNAPYETDLLITVITFGILLNKFF